MLTKDDIVRLRKSAFDHRVLRGVAARMAVNVDDVISLCNLALAVESQIRKLEERCAQVDVQLAAMRIVNDSLKRQIDDLK